jgi:mannan endo-1,4-beta-mannosidase
MKIKYIAIVCIFSMTGLFYSCKTSHDFVRVKDTRFVVKQKPYYYIGTNFWFGAYLGADANYGNRARLVQELDLLQKLGVKNLRVAAASEESNFAYPLSPPFQYKNGSYNEKLLEGLDFLLSEMAKRNMRAVLFLNNYWEWTGGMAEYISWSTGKEVPDPTKDSLRTWDDFVNFAAGFYENGDAQIRYLKYIEMLVKRKNVYTKKSYQKDPTIMAWELANEPRPSKPGDQEANMRVFEKWIDKTASFIHSIDDKHLVTTGSEGNKGTLNNWDYTRQAHQSKSIDYITIHMWPKNWGWYKADSPGTMTATKQNTANYIADGIKIARQLDKPLVIEEFGFMRDGEKYAPGTPVTARDEYYQFIFQLLQDSIKMGSPLAGTNFWGWGGEGRAQHPDHQWRVGDKTYLGDPYSEPQGLNSVYNDDKSTLDIISKYAKELESLSSDPKKNKSK